MDQANRTDTGTDETMMGGPLMRGLKIALVVMGILIVLGFAAVGYEVYRRNTDPAYRASLESEQARVTVPAPVRAAGTPLLLPPGAIITETVPVGRQLAVTVEQLDGTQILYFADPGSNAFVEFLRTQPGRAQ